MGFPFLKMSGAGNDFVIVAADRAPFHPDAARARAIADRVTGIGCDQLISISPSSRAHATMRIWNADGGEVEACGNGARCVGWLLMKAGDRDDVRIETAAGILRATLGADGRVTIDMGPPRLGWRDIPLACEMDTREVMLLIDPRLKAPGCVSMGNPHAVFFVPDAEAAPVREAGPVIEHHWLFPERVNVGFAEVKAGDRIRLKVWERGAGQTVACGTGACAALVAAHRRGLCGRAAVLEMDGGELFVEWRASDDHVLLTGPVAVEFSGLLPDACSAQPDMARG
jgi:diaminopimelate epimerase